MSDSQGTPSASLGDLDAEAQALVEDATKALDSVKTMVKIAEEAKVLNEGGKKDMEVKEKGEEETGSEGKEIEVRKEKEEEKEKKEEKEEEEEENKKMEESGKEKEEAEKKGEKEGEVEGNVTEAAEKPKKKEENEEGEVEGKDKKNDDANKERENVDLVEVREEQGEGGQVKEGNEMDQLPILLPDQVKAIVELIAEVDKIPFIAEWENDQFAVVCKSLLEVTEHSLLAKDKSTATAAVALVSFMECWKHEIKGGEYKESAAGLEEAALKVNDFLKDFASRAAVASLDHLTLASRPQDLHPALLAKHPRMIPELIRRLGGVKDCLSLKGIFFFSPFLHFHPIITKT